MDDGGNKGKRRQAGFDQSCVEGVKLTCGELRFLNEFGDFHYRREVETGQRLTVWEKIKRGGDEGFK